MEQNGYTVKVKDVGDLTEVKAEYHVPAELRSCHTAIVNGYVIEGHVPAAAVERLAAERPDIVGLAVSGMPAGSPGMDVEGAKPQPFNVIAFDKSGKTEVFASYPQ